MVQESSFVSLKIKADFASIVALLKESVQDKGLKSIRIIDVSGMLSRTAKAYGVKQPVYANAQKVEFCSAEITHQLSSENPDNIVLCPFSISVYTLSGDSKNVHISYRKPQLGSVKTDATNKAAKLIEDIVREATAW